MLAGKPRIRLMQCIWCCYLPDWARTRIVGMGYSPSDAYEDWKRLGGTGKGGLR